MKPEQFIRDWGLPEAKRLINESPEWASEWCMECKDYINYCDSDVVSDCESCVSIAGLERLVESLDLIKAYGGIESCKQSLYMLHELTEDPEPIREAVRDHETIYGGGDES
ncbi:hypothetical protein [Acinetobacter pittii]|uniref:hypothetical protein n=2 Tax=Acinetobacter pittii TaxID=48296 RepID=UPI002A002E5B|nr:hypothetical protein [Acinetobacter pittii]MDX8160579.1 hypothetical protein [Acinetobacter pittii]MDX8265125.1 hypothetical protein [Acinetobacter pittii]